MLMWFDLLALGVLIFFALRGAMRGFIYQIASLAGIVLCFVFADAVSAAAGPYVHLDPPMNNWVIMLGSYLGFTLLCFLAARMLNDFLEKCKLKEFDRHLGFIFGLVKGVLLVLIATFFIVTVSQSARAALKNSYTGRYCAILMDRLEPILPKRLHVALEEYIHLLDSPDLPLVNGHDPFDDHDHDHDNSPLGPSTSLPSSFDPFRPTSGQSGSNTGIDSLWSQLQSVFDTKSQQVVDRALQNAAPQDRAQIQEKLNSLIKSIPEKDRAEIQQQIVNAGAGQLQQYLDQKLEQLGKPVSGNTGGANSGTMPFSVPALPTSTSQINSLMSDIGRVYSQAPQDLQNINQDIQRRIQGVPANVSQAVLQDWKADLLGTKPDPDPSTNMNATIETRILSQIQKQGINFNQLTAEVQQRLQAELNSGRTAQ
ncbi:CvpA family protein [Planctomicrobium sp. SH668]|uniref:CvpA family protein n=1 Tax=Planctomicrobium sp. SH668 TaxID=3448126 RepID=UPI003F5CA8AF